MYLFIDKKIEKILFIAYYLYVKIINKILNKFKHDRI
jgi:hypothetical protein